MISKNELALIDRLVSRFRLQCKVDRCWDVVTLGQAGCVVRAEKMHRHWTLVTRPDTPDAHVAKTRFFPFHYLHDFFLHPLRRAEPGTVALAQDRGSENVQPQVLRNWPLRFACDCSVPRIAMSMLCPMRISNAQAHAPRQAHHQTDVAHGCIPSMAIENGLDP